MSANIEISAASSVGMENASASLPYRLEDILPPERIYTELDRMKIKTKIMDQRRLEYCGYEWY